MQICKHADKIILSLLCIKQSCSSGYKGPPEMLRLALWCNQCLSEDATVDNLRSMKRVGRVDGNCFQLREHPSLCHLLDFLKFRPEHRADLLDKFVYSVPVCCVDPFLPSRPQHQTNHHHVVDTVEQRLTDVSLLRKLNRLCPSVYTASIWLFQSNLMCNCTSRYLWLNTILMVVIGVGWVLLQPHLKSKTISLVFAMLRWR